MSAIVFVIGERNVVISTEVCGSCSKDNFQLRAELTSTVTNGVLCKSGTLFEKNSIKILIMLVFMRMKNIS